MMQDLEDHFDFREVAELCDGAKLFPLFFGEFDLKGVVKLQPSLKHLQPVFEDQGRIVGIHFNDGTANFVKGYPLPKRGDVTAGLYAENDGVDAVVDHRENPTVRRCELELGPRRGNFAEISGDNIAESHCVSRLGSGFHSSDAAARGIRHSCRAIRIVHFSLHSKSF